MIVYDCRFQKVVCIFLALQMANKASRLLTRILVFTLLIDSPQGCDEVSDGHCPICTEKVRVFGRRSKTGTLTPTQHCSSYESSQFLPASFALGQNYPNPFNPGTTICYDMPKPTSVILRAFDLQGR